jgi:hypothetical protein
LYRGENEPAVEKLFAQRRRGDQRDEGQPLDQVLRHHLARHLMEKGVAVGGEAREPAQAEELARGDQERESSGCGHRELRLGQSETQAHCRQAVSVAAPSRNAGRDPLEGNC